MPLLRNREVELDHVGVGRRDALVVERVEVGLGLALNIDTMVGMGFWYIRVRYKNGFVSWIEFLYLLQECNLSRGIEWRTGLVKDAQIHANIGLFKGQLRER